MHRERARRQQRRVAVDDEHLLGAARLGQADLDRVARALLLGLHGEAEVPARERPRDALLHELGLVADDRHDPIDARAERGVDERQDHRAAEEGMEHLGELGAHARPLAGGEDEGGRLGFGRHRGDNRSGAHFAPTNPSRFSIPRIALGPKTGSRRG